MYGTFVVMGLSWRVRHSLVERFHTAWLLATALSFRPLVIRAWESLGGHVAWLLAAVLFLVTLFAGVSLGQGNLQLPRFNSFLRRVCGMLHSGFLWSCEWLRGFGAFL